MKRSDINAIESAARDVAHWGAVIEAGCLRLSDRSFTVEQTYGGKGYPEFLVAAYELREALKKLPRRKELQ